jgi:hypothetical protein
VLCKFAVFIILSDFVLAILIRFVFPSNIGVDVGDFVLAILIRFVFPSNIGVDVGVRVEVGCWS